MKKKTLIRLLLCGLLLSYYESNQIVICQTKSNYIGKYKYSVNQDFPSDTIILDLQTNGRFEYFPSKVTMDFSYCDSIKGYWRIKRNSIILNSDFQTKDYIKVLSKNEQKDSIKIRLVAYPEDTVLSKMELAIVDNKNKIYSLTKADENGVIVIPKGYKIFGFEAPKIPQKLKGGYYYQFTSVNCMPKIFENHKLKIFGDTLIRYEKYSMIDRNKKGKKIKWTSKREYIRNQSNK